MIRAREIKTRLSRESIYLDLENPVDAGALDHPLEFLKNVSDNDIRKEWLKAFLSAYIERDLRLLGLDTSPAILQKLIQMISTLQGGLLNASNLTIKYWKKTCQITESIHS